MNDESIIPFGKHKGLKLTNVPAQYLLWWYEQNKPLMEYIEDNMELLQKENK